MASPWSLLPHLLPPASASLLSLPRPALESSALSCGIAHSRDSRQPGQALPLSQAQYIGDANCLPEDSCLTPVPRHGHLSTSCNPPFPRATRFAEQPTRSRS